MNQNQTSQASVVDNDTQTATTEHESQNIVVEHTLFSTTEQAFLNPHSATTPTTQASPMPQSTTIQSATALQTNTTIQQANSKVDVPLQRLSKKRTRNELREVCLCL